jgi:tetratricopeptide (TPR) repeat protein
MKPHVKAIACAIAMSTASDAAAAAARALYDEQEVNAMRARNPHAVELLEKGESLAAAGAPKEADALFRQGEAEYPDSSLLWRRDCEARTALGEQEAAIDACSKAMQRLNSGDNVRAMVSALVDGSSAPTTGQLFQALMLVERWHEMAPGQPVAAAATCDIAERIEDGVMLQRCAEELQRIAPNDPATGRALARLASRCPPARFWAGWLSIAAAVVITIGHALRRVTLLLRRGAAAAAACLILCAVPRIASAADPPAPHGGLSKFPVDDEHPDRSIPSEDERNAQPLEFGYWLQDLTAKGLNASRKGDHAASARFYEVLANVVADRAVPFVKLCEEYEALGDLKRAINSCGDALLRDGVTVHDYTRFVHLVLAESGAPSAKEVAALGQVLQHMKEDPAGREAVDDLECEVGLRTSNVAQLEECTAALAARAPDDPKTISFQWALAILKGNFGRAEQLIARARALGMPAQSVASMQRKTSETRTQHRIHVALWAAAIAFLLTGIAIAARSLRRRRPEQESAIAPTLDVASDMPR